RFERNCRALAGLAVYSRDCLRALRERTRVRYDERSRGILHFATSDREFAELARNAEAMRTLGIERQVKSAAECLQIEPALRHSEERVAGGAYTPQDESGDAHRFTQELARSCAELAGYDASVNPARCNAIVRRIRQLFPGLGGITVVERWAGLRPATPNNVPIIGRTRLRKLFLNTGHGTLGWTLACGSAKALAD